MPGGKDARQGRQSATHIDDPPAWGLLAQEIAVKHFTESTLGRHVFQPAMTGQPFVSRLLLPFKQAADRIVAEVVIDQFFGEQAHGFLGRHSGRCGGSVHGRVPAYRTPTTASWNWPISFSYVSREVAKS
jgi:hypothetical protein